MKSSHLSAEGEARMVDVSAKAATARAATARGEVAMSAEALSALRGGTLAKGDALAAARIAGIMAAKRTGELIPLCHPLPLESIEVRLRVHERGVTVEAEARVTAKTGVEMEALTAVSAACLTLYDMAKSVDKAMAIGPIVLVEKTGGKSGPWRREDR